MLDMRRDRSVLDAWIEDAWSSGEPAGPARRL